MEELTDSATVMQRDAAERGGSYQSETRCNISKIYCSIIRMVQ